MSSFSPAPSPPSPWSSSGLTPPSSMVPLLLPYPSLPHSVIYMSQVLLQLKIVSWLFSPICFWNGALASNCTTQPFLPSCPNAQALAEKKKRNRTFIDPVSEVGATIIWQKKWQECKGRPENKCSLHLIQKKLSQSCFQFVSNLGQKLLCCQRVVSKFPKVVSGLSQSCPNAISMLSQWCSKIVSKLFKRSPKADNRKYNSDSRFD